MVKNDRWFYIVVLFCLLVCLGSLYIVKDAEQRCDQRYKPLIKQLNKVQDDELYNSLKGIDWEGYNAIKNNDKNASE